MVFDPGEAMHKKEECESARLMDVEFRQRARATRLLAQALGLEEAALVQEIARPAEAGLIDRAASTAGRMPDDVAAEYARCSGIARQQLIEERGDPTPHRLGSPGARLRDLFRFPTGTLFETRSFAVRAGLVPPAGPLYLFMKQIDRPFLGEVEVHGWSKSNVPLFISTILAFQLLILRSGKWRHGYFRAILRDIRGDA